MPKRVHRAVIPFEWQVSGKYEKSNVTFISGPTYYTALTES